MYRITERMKLHLIPAIAIGICTVLGANYPTNEGANHDEPNKQMAEPASQIKKSNILDIGSISNSNDWNKGGGSTGVSNRTDHKPLPGNSAAAANDSGKPGNSGFTTTEHPEGTRTTKPKPKPIKDKTSPPAKPQEPTEPPKQEEPSKPEPEQQQPDPVYLLSVETPVVKVEALPTEKEEPLINIEIGKEKDNGDKTKADPKQQHKIKTQNSDEPAIHHDTRNRQHK